ncbi:MAG: hypothetical protein WBA98_03685 [Gordonia sp. (in: high G+C Gram-positive bacteria)]|uniref:hypothetical protein n=1 Tax=Gordonia sp. (in: high G+C Gram-positive bacteria) TaxID=84139 RepID=UPI003C765AB4
MDLTLHRGQWMPLLPESVRMVVIMALPVEAIMRAYDYLTPDIDETAVSLSVVERMMPLGVWGVLCAIVGVVTLWGLAWRWPRTAITGLRLGAATYAVLAAGQWIAVVENPWLDGIRGPGMASIFAFAYFGMALGYVRQQRLGQV